MPSQAKIFISRVCLKEGQIHFSRLVLVGCVLNIVAVVGYFLYFVDKGYLPAPFIYDKFDTFMDFFHVASWSTNSNRYTEWQSVYPPLVFLLFQVAMLITDQHEIINEGAFALRDNWDAGVIIIVLMYMLSIIYCFRGRLYSDFTRTEKLALLTFFLSSPVVLFSLERGNVIALIVPLLAVALTKNGWTRALSIALMINIKPYCVLFLFMYLVRKEYLWFLNACVASLLIYIVTGVVVDRNFYLLLQNLAGFGGNSYIFSPNAIASMASSIDVFSYNMSYRYFMGGASFGKASSEASFGAIIKIINVVAIILLLIIMFVRQRNACSKKLLASISVAVMNATVAVGGYSLIFYIATLPVFRSMRYRDFYTLIIIILFMPLDFIVTKSTLGGMQNIWLSGATTSVEIVDGIGSIIRPIINFSFLLLLLSEFGFYKEETCL